MIHETDALVAELPLKSEYALLLNNLVRMQESPYYATSKADLVAAEIAITRLERERDQLLERVRGLEAASDVYPDKVSIYYMWDCHMFTRIESVTPDAMTEEFMLVAEKDHFCGAICEPILLKGEKEVRRVSVGKGFSAGSFTYGNPKHEHRKMVKQCVELIFADADVSRLLAARQQGEGK